LLKDCVVRKGELDDLPAFIARNHFDVIYHFAAQVAVTTSYESPRSDFRVNAEGTFNLLHALGAFDPSRKIEDITPVIFTSTNKVFGNNVNAIPIEEHETRYDFHQDSGIKGKGVHENFCIDMTKHTPYGVSKLVADLYVQEAHGIVNRCSCMYGTNQFGNEDQGWVAHFAISKVLGKPLTIYGNGKQVRDLLFIQDMVRLLELQGERANELRGQVFSVGGGYENTASLLELCKELDVQPGFAEWRPADQKVYYADVSKSHKLIGWKPKVSVKEGLRQLHSWASENKELLARHHRQ
jgi:CDP-paratose 2-epimerase